MAEAEGVKIRQSQGLSKSYNDMDGIDRSRCILWERMPSASSKPEKNKHSAGYAGHSVSLRFMVVTREDIDRDFSYVLRVLLPITR